MAGLVPANVLIARILHEVGASRSGTTWVPGTSPGMANFLIATNAIALPDTDLDGRVIAVGTDRSETVAGLVPATYVVPLSPANVFITRIFHEVGASRSGTTWVPGTSPGMTNFPNCDECECPL